MWVLKKVRTSKGVVLAVLLVEILLILGWSAIVFSRFSGQEPLVFEAEDMQLLYADGGTESGSYMDQSYADVKSVVTPSFRLQNGLYEIQASFAGRGIIKAGLIYDQSRNGKELFDNEEFTVLPERGSFAFRVKIHEDSPVRLKLRLTGDAVEGDYIQMFDVRVMPSKMTCVYQVFLAAALFFAVDLLAFGYCRYYRRWSSRRQSGFCIFAFTILLTSMPVFREGLLTGKDVVFHLQRIEGLYQGLLSGQFPVRIQPGWLYGHGYAVSVFYGDIFLYFPAFLRMIGFTVEEACKCYLLAVNTATAVIAFYSFRRIAGDDFSGMAGSVLYLGSPYRIKCLYSLKMGRSGAMMFYPLVIAGFYLLFTEDVNSKEYKGIWKYLALGFTGLLMTHMLSGLMAAIYAVLACLIFCRRVCRKETLLELTKAAGSFILLNLWFLIPFLDYMLRERLQINTSLGGAVGAGADYYVMMENFTQEGKNLYQLVTDRDSLGYALLFSTAVYIVLMPRQKKEESLVKQGRCILAWTLFSVWVCMKSFPVVELSKISGVICRYFLMTQFQVRFMSVAVVFAACLGALLFAGYMRGGEVKKADLLIGALLCLTVWQCDSCFQTMDESGTFLDAADLDFYKGDSGRDFAVGNGEYLPVSLDQSLLTEEIVPQEGVTLGDVERDSLTYRVEALNVSAEEKEITLPVLYYTGYRAYDLQTKAALQVSGGDNGCVAVRVPGGYEGRFEMKYDPAWYWRAAEIISLLSVVAYGIDNRRKESVTDGN